MSRSETSMNSLNREAWLQEVSKSLIHLFKGFTMAPYRVTCGWPCANALGRKSRRLGECHSALSSKGGFHEIFISPLLAEPLEVAGTLCHELAHVAAGIEAQHGPRYAKVCKHVGLTKGKPVHAMPGERLEEKILKVVSRVGEYPHTALDPVMKKVSKSVKTLTLECPSCGCKASMSIKWLLEVGPPRCGCGSELEMIPS